MFKRVFQFTLTIVGALAICGCAASYSSFNYQTLPNPNKEPYRLQPGDRINIRVLRNEGNTGFFTIRPDGYISLLLGGEVRLKGLTLDEARREVVKRLKKYIEDAEEMISVSLDQVHGVWYSVIGEVNRPGLFDTTHYPTVLEALANAGGLTVYAQPNAIYVLRDKQSIPFSYDRTVKDPSGNQNFFLLGGDIVVIP
jgi:polysaccharide biosynthesis/export protein